MALGVVGPLGGALFLRCPGVWNVGDCGSEASGFGFTSFGAFRRYWASRSLAYGRGAASVLQFGSRSSLFFFSII